MLELTIFPPAFGLRNVSPFCLKVELALKYLGIDYKVNILDDPRKAPKGKLPYITTEEGEYIADSELIFKYLERISNGALYGCLTSKQVAEGRAWTRLAEDHLYWMLVASRWLDDDWFPHVRNGFFGQLPGPLTNIIAYFAQKQVRQTYALHGLGKHSLEEQKGLANDSLKAINDTVGETGYILGSELTCFDFTLAAMIAGIFDQKPETWMVPIADQHHYLKDYAERVQKHLSVYARDLV